MTNLEKFIQTGKEKCEADNKGPRDFVPLDSTSESRAKKCVTHHWACDCRELEIAKLKARADKWEKVAERLAEELSELTDLLQKTFAGVPPKETLAEYEKTKGEK